MKRPQATTREPFAISLIIGFIAVLAGGVGCGRSRSNCDGLTAPTGRTYTISGLVTQYRGGPVSGATVYGYTPGGNYCNGIPSTQTDGQGHYSMSGPSFEDGVSIEIWKTGYAPALKTNLSSHSPANVMLHPSLTVRAAGDTVTGTVWGDEFLDGDDFLFGGLCVRTPCKVVFINVDYDTYALGFPDIELRLHWTDPAAELGLYTSDVEVVDFSPPKFFERPRRLCCSSDLMAVLANRRNYSPPEYETYLAIGFERVAGGPPGPNDSEQFELTVQPVR